MAENVKLIGIPIINFLCIYIIASSQGLHTLFCLWRVNKKLPQGETSQKTFQRSRSISWRCKIHMVIWAHPPLRYKNKTKNNGIVMLRFLNLQPKHFLINWQIKTIPRFVLDERDQIIPQGRNLLAFTKHVHQSLINFLWQKGESLLPILTRNILVQLKLLMENLEIKCSQLCLDTTINIVFMILQSTSSSTFKASHQNFSVSLGLSLTLKMLFFHFQIG